MNITVEKAIEVLKNFKIEGEITKITPYGNGHINATFIVETNKNLKYIFQAVNCLVFKKPVEVMSNIKLVTEMLKKKAKDKREVLTPIETLDGNIYLFGENESFFRCYEFINDSICIELPDNTADFYECGYAFGKFQRDLADFPAEKLYEIIPDFHNTVWRYENLLKAEAADIKGRAKEVKSELQFAHKRKDFYSVLSDANKTGKLPLRVSHNDTKCNNVLLDANTRKALCVIDLDTIMPGFSVTDFGDAIRFGASTAPEDEKDLSKVVLNIELYKSYVDGFIKGSGNQLLDEEIMLLPEGAKMMTIECGIRFLTDFLEGDTYFKTEYPDHNLVRCRTQFKLVEEMEKHWDELKNIVKNYCKNK